MSHAAARPPPPPTVTQPLLLDAAGCHRPKDATIQLASAGIDGCRHIVLGASWTCSALFLDKQMYQCVKISRESYLKREDDGQDPSDRGQYVKLGEDLQSCSAHSKQF